MTCCRSCRSDNLNSYVQNIRNNTNKRRTPKWARKAGFIDETEENRKKAKSQWSGRCVPPSARLRTAAASSRFVACRTQH